MKYNVEYKIFDKKIWAKIFYHNSQGYVFFTEEEAKFNIGDSKKFSLLKDIDLFKGTLPYYEFLLEYPELPGYQHWIQKTNPLLLTDVDDESYFKCINCSWETYFRGLFYSTDSPPKTFLEGDTRHNADWRFAIGAYQAKQGSKIPGPPTSLTDGNDVYEVRLWIRTQIHSSFLKVTLRNSLLIITIIITQSTS